MKLRDGTSGKLPHAPAQVLTKACLKSSLQNAFTTAAFAVSGIFSRSEPTTSAPAPALTRAISGFLSDHSLPLVPNYQGTAGNQMLRKIFQCPSPSLFHTVLLPTPHIAPLSKRSSPSPEST